jgi:hypothetical protein
VTAISTCAPTAWPMMRPSIAAPTSTKANSPPGASMKADSVATRHESFIARADRKVTTILIAMKPAARPTVSAG